MLKFKRDFTRAGILTIHFLWLMPISLGLLFVATFAATQYYEFLSQALNSTDQGPWIAQLMDFCFEVV